MTNLQRWGPFEYELHFVFRKGEAGFYPYIIARMPQNANELTPGQTDWSVGQVRWSIRSDPSLFTYVQNEGEAPDKLPRPDQVTARYQVMDATYRQPDGSAYTKYQDAISEANTHVFGLVGSEYGLWFIKGGNDYTNGLPTAREIGAHQTDTTPIVNWAPEAAHYGRDTAQPSPGWSHIWGPIFVYLNHGDNMSDIYQDALQRAHLDEQAWPYKWLADPIYEANSRGTVSGKLTITGKVPQGGATVILAAPGGDWQHQSLGYVYYAKTDASGNFSIPHVRPGMYTLYAYQKGIYQEYQQDGIQVSSNKATDVGNIVWKQKSEGKLLWQIGTPDRSADEFLHGNEYRKWGLWLRYPFEFPNGVNYYVGKSNPATDWNYVQPLNKTPGAPFNLLAPFSNDPAVWTIHFNTPRIPKDTHGSLTIAIAAERAPDVDIVLNGTKLYEYKTSASDSAMPRLGISGNNYTVLQIPFDTSLLKSDSDNVLSLVPAQSLLNQQGQRITDYYSSIMYDALKMELVPDARK
ncbi:MAG: carboxypeptidase regulatory-like domain-containing protein [Alicyclobacillus herbarius]|uniref:polysaccharide lyase family protein n=1 Tax=Alicyclobacillus herbarius TaxID=122960 RepID=UPI000400F71E|nr:polysaccharide lyase family protein [Alicyclobacillus herbarius]MCL6633148.1 carboxypeptidase regulatory-like domain-containing protein [Alicyclobacillus herbarius]